MSAQDMLEKVTPLVDKSRTLGRQLITGDDDHGPYLAYRLDNRNMSCMYGWYVYVSPEDKPLVKEHNWCGKVMSHGCSICVRRVKTTGGFQRTFILSREIWERMHGFIPKSVYVYCMRHPLDFRRNLLTTSIVASIHYASCNHKHGITWNKNARSWQVQITIRRKTHYIGQADYPDEGYRMYNRYLRDLKNKFPKEETIQCMSYNDIFPKF
jgi:hypothetical protein